MRRILRCLALVLGCGLAWTASAQGVVSSPEFEFSPFTKAQAGAGNAVTVTLRWKPGGFSPPSAADKHEVTVTDLAGGGPQTFSAGDGTNGSAPLLLADGHEYAITVAACQTATCTLSSSSTASTTRTTRVDATLPTVTAQINGGAGFTNRREVTLGLTAADPLVAGAPGTSSGVTQQAVDVDGDGSFPCSILIGGTSDTSGCAGAFAPSVAATLPAGDGPKTVGVKVGDGARANTVPCTSVFCVVVLGSPILGNESAVATDSIVLDTVKPIAIGAQDRFTVAPGGTVAFDATASLDPGTPAAVSGVDPPGTTWSFKDGTAVATGAKVSHAFTKVGTFVGELRVRDRAGNLSDVRPFSITVEPAAVPAAGSGSVRGVTGRAAFRIDRVRVRARYVRGRLVGSMTVSGTAARAGSLRADLRRPSRSRLIARVRAKRLRAGPFTRTFRLPGRLTPGRYRLSFVGPGGTLRSTLTLRAPRGGLRRN